MELSFALVWLFHFLLKTLNLPTLLVLQVQAFLLPRIGLNLFWQLTMIFVYRLGCCLPAERFSGVPFLCCWSIKKALGSLYDEENTDFHTGWNAVESFVICRFFEWYTDRVIWDIGNRIFVFIMLHCQARGLLFCHGVEIVLWAYDQNVYFMLAFQCWYP